jgi:hypothetical protein
MSYVCFRLLGVNLSRGQQEPAVPRRFPAMVNLPRSGMNLNRNPRRNINPSSDLFLMSRAGSEINAMTGSQRPASRSTRSIIHIVQEIA